MSNHDDVFTCASNYYKLVGLYLAPLQPKMSFSQLSFAAFTSQILLKKFLGLIFIALYYVSCVCYAFDLVLTIRNPLYPASKRKRWYVIVGVISVLLSILIEIKSIQLNEGANLGEKVLA